MQGFTHRWLDPIQDEPQREWIPDPTTEPLVARLLWARGYRDESSATRFRDPTLAGMHDPSLLPDCDRAAGRLLEALRAGEPIVIYGDYDVDGVSAASILYHCFRAVSPGASVSTYIPHRMDEGYGLHADAMRTLAVEGARIVVSVDCGVTGFAAADAARQAGIELIITDHHALSSDGRLPGAMAVVHPRAPGSTYPFPDLCGAGVAFKLAWRLMTLSEGRPKLSEELRHVLLDCLALAALGTIADIVPLVDENRVIARHGLRRLRSTRITGLTALIEEAGLGGEAIDAERVGFILGPRLNACGRMGHAKHALEMLTTAPEAEARRIARELDKLNSARQRTEKAIFEEASAMAEELGMTGDDSRAIVLASAGWHAGVVGIVCSRMIGKYHRPTILMDISDGVCHGSGRGIDGFNLHAALCSCSDLLMKFGGHDMAAGLTLDHARLAEFTERFMSHARSVLSPEALVPGLRIDCRSTIEELTPRAVEQVQDLGPFGRGNPHPRLLIEDMQIARPPEPMGSRGEHLSLFVRQGSREMRLVGWRWGSVRDRLRSGSMLDAVVEPRISAWNGRIRVEPTIVDLRMR